MSFVFCPPRLTTSQLGWHLHGSWLHHCTVYDTVTGTLATPAPPTMAASHLTLFSTTDTLCLLVSTLVATQHCLHSQTTSVSTLALQLQNRQPQKHFFKNSFRKMAAGSRKPLRILKSSFRTNAHAHYHRVLHVLRVCVTFYVWVKERGNPGPEI